MKLKIAIIGAGVIGLSAAVKIAENYFDNPNVQVVLISDQVTPHTTGDMAAGLWNPYLCGTTSVANINKWSKETHDFFFDLWRNGLANEVGICLQPVFQVTTEMDSNRSTEPTWNDIVFGFKRLTNIELKRLSKEHGRQYLKGHHFITFTCEPIRLLPYLFKRFQNAGGQFINKKIDDFNELDAYDFVINCTGLNANVLANDIATFPIRGQVARVKAPWVNYTILDDSSDGRYIITNLDSVVLGGTHQKNDWNLKVSKEDSEFILSGCTQLLPALKNVQILKEVVGLRPGRDSIRLEVENFKTKSGNKLIIIHNYGHGGSGITLAWGCATDVLNLLKGCCDGVKSKL